MKIIRGKHFSDPPIVRGYCEGSPVLAFGYTYIPTVPPELTGFDKLQAGNQNPQKKITLRHSDAIGSNYIGCATTRMPRICENDYRPEECFNLIDGNQNTCWVSKALPNANVTPIWIRLDFPMEKTCNRVVLRKRPLDKRRILGRGTGWGPESGGQEIGRGIPRHLKIEFSIDGTNWDCVFDGDTNDNEEKEFFEMKMELKTVRMIRITGTNLTRVENLLYTFSIANVEVYDEQDINIALLNKGVGIEVNSTTHTHGQELEVQRYLFPVHYDLGCKWIRVGYHDDVINWHWVEQKKGKLEIDDYADATITEVYDNGVETIMCLNYGNRLYTDQGELIMPQLWEFNYETPEPPKTEEALAAWEHYCRFMVRHFKDRVRYFEIWNEWNNGPYWGDDLDTNLYIKIARIAINAVREEYPEAKIVLGSIAGFLHEIYKWTPEEIEYNRKNNDFMRVIAEFAKDVDVIGFHPFYQADPQEERWIHYEDNLRAFDAFCKGEGFCGTYTVSEYNYSNVVIPYDDEVDMWWGDFTCTELEKAMYISRLLAIHTKYAITSLFCESFNSSHPLDLSLFRRTTVQDPIDAQQPQAAYYMIRNLSTYLDGCAGAEGQLAVAGATERYVYQAYDKGNEKVFAVWREGRAKEKFQGEAVELVIDGEYDTLIGFDPMNGFEQELNIFVENGRTIVADWLLQAYPTFVRGYRK